MKEPFLDPQKTRFLELYTNPKSNTFGDAYNTAIKVGYSESYAKNIMHILPDWLSDNVGTAKRLKKAEKLMDKIMDLEAVDEEGKVDNALISNQVKIINLIAKGIGKNTYSERTELTGKNGDSIHVTIEDLSELSDAELAKLIAGGEEGESEEGTREETP